MQELDKEINEKSSIENNGVGYSNRQSSKWDVEKYIELLKTAYLEEIKAGKKIKL